MWPHIQLAILSILQALPTQARFTQLFSHITAVKCCVPTYLCMQGLPSSAWRWSSQAGQRNLPLGSWPGKVIENPLEQVWQAGKQLLAAVPRGSRTCWWDGVELLLACNMRQHPQQGLEEHPVRRGAWQGSSGCLQCPAAHSPHPTFQDPSSSQPTRTQSSQVRRQQHKGSRCSVLILISNFTSTSSLSYWCFCPCADAALEAECCCVSEGAASLGSRWLQQKSAHKPAQLPPKNNKMGNTALSTEPEWEVASHVPSSVTAPGQSSKVWQLTHPMGDICCSVSRIWNIWTPQSVWDGNGHFCFSCHSAGVTEQCHSSL